MITLIPSLHTRRISSRLQSTNKHTRFSIFICYQTYVRRNALLDICIELRVINTDGKTIEDVIANTNE